MGGDDSQGFPYEMYAKAMPRAICYGGLRDQILA
jgi:hypothetical protein